MKLYFAPNACSIASHVALREAEIPFELVKVDFMRGRMLPDGTAFTTINPRGYVPALVMDDGELFTEGASILQLIADRVPEKKLAPRPGTTERIRLQEWLVFIATELHKGAGPFFSPDATEAYKASAKQKLVTRLGQLAAGVADKAFLLGDTFTVADAYALYALRAFKNVVKGDLGEIPGLTEYLARIVERPTVRAALEAEGLKA